MKNAPELKLELVTESQKWLASKYKADAAEWGVIGPEPVGICFMSGYLKIV